MKYWLLTTEYPPQFGGGIGTYCKQLAVQMAKNGIEVTVFLPNKAVKDHIVRNEAGIRLIEFSPYLKDTSSFLGYETMLSYSFAEVVRSIIKQEGAPDWIEAQEYNGIAYYILQKRELGEEYFKELKVLVTCHAPSFLYFEYNHINNHQLPYFWIGEMEKYCIRAADICISPSQYLVDRLQERLRFDREYFVVHNPFSATQKVHNKATEQVAVFLAKLSPSKGILQTLAAFKQIWGTGAKYKLKLIGDSTFFYHAKNCMMGQFIAKAYDAYIKEGLLEIVGSVEPAQLQNELAAARVILVPSTVDNFPYTVLESMAFGKVVLASEQGGQREIISHMHNGLLFDHRKDGDFVEKLHKAFDFSEAQLSEIGDNAAATVREKYNAALHLKTKLELLRQHTEVHAENGLFKFVYDKSVSDSTPATNSVEGLLSVVIPYYNMGKYIDDTISSIRKSTFKNIELIIVNDGSTEKESLAKLQSLATEENLFILSQANKGLSNTRNAGALAAKGEFLAFLDADDTVDPTYFTKAVNVLRNKANVHFVGCWVQYFEGSTNIWPSLHPEPPYLLYHNMVNSSSLVYKKKSFLASGLNDDRFVFGMEDYDSVINMVKHGFLGVVIPEVLFKYRVRKNSMARGFNDVNQAYLYSLLSDKHKDIYSSYTSELFKLLNANGPGYLIDNPTMDHHLLKTSKTKILYKIYGKLKRSPLARKLALKIYSTLQHN